MPSNAEYDDQILISYLLRSASPEQTERLDELSVVDDDIALRLRTVENDLVDAYVRGELPSETQQRFTSAYLSSPQRGHKAAVAGALYALERDRVARVEQPVRNGAHKQRTRRLARAWQMPSSAWLLQPGFAAVVSVVLIAVAYLAITDIRLRTEIREARNEETALKQDADRLRNQLQATAHVSPAEPVKSPIKVSPAAAIPSILLLAPTRGAGSIPAISIPGGVGYVNIRLRLDSDDFHFYQATLWDLATNRAIWRVRGVKAALRGQYREIALNIVGTLLKQQNYALELSGIGVDGSPEVLASYAFRVVLK